MKIEKDIKVTIELNSKDLGILLDLLEVVDDDQFDKDSDVGRMYKAFLDITRLRSES